MAKGLVLSDFGMAITLVFFRSFGKQPSRKHLLKSDIQKVGKLLCSRFTLTLSRSRTFLIVKISYNLSVVSSCKHSPLMACEPYGKGGVCDQFPAQLLRFTFHDVVLVCLSYYVKEQGEFFDIGGFTIPREYVLREAVLPVLRRLCGAV